MIQLKDVSKFYSANGITNVGIQNVNLTLGKGEIVAITGESGSGKSTLLNVLTKIDTFDEGEIYYKGNATSYFNISDMDDFRKNKVGFIFQNYNILDSYTVLDNVKLPLLLKGVGDAEAEKQALKLLAKVGLSKKIKSRGSKLSGGEKQRCVIARALASDCEILACDEPTGNLDSKTASEIIELIKEVSEDKLVLIVTHNFSEVESMVTRRLKVSDGRIVEDITMKDVQLPIDENEEINLDYQPIPKKICAKIALSNVKFTPKKTILVGIVFFIIAFVTFALLNLVNSGITNSLYENEYYNCLTNYMSVYKEDASPIDVSLLEGYNYKVNSFGYEKNENYVIGERSEYNANDEKYYYYLNTAYLVLNEMMVNYELVEGHMPENDNEVVLYISDSYGEYMWYEDYVGQKINMGCVEGNSDFVVSGICKYTDSYCTTDFISGSDKFANYANNACVNYKLKIKYDGEENELTASKSIKKETGLYIDKQYESYSVELISCMIEDIYSMDTDNIKIIYEKDVENGIQFIINPFDNFEIEPYFISLSVNPSLAKLVRRSIERKDLKVNYPFVDGENKIMKLLGKVLSFVSNLELSCYLIGIFFITYLIISKIFASRIKDYEILRTLGVTKKDMKKIVNYEVLSIGFVMMVLALILGYVLIYCVQALTFMRKFSLLTLLMYLGVITLFVIFMAKRFNKKLFKFSVRKSFEGEEDD